MQLRGQQSTCHSDSGTISQQDKWQALDSLLLGSEEEWYALWALTMWNNFQLWPPTPTMVSDLLRDRLVKQQRLEGSGPRLLHATFSFTFTSSVTSASGFLSLNGDRSNSTYPMRLLRKLGKLSCDSGWEKCHCIVNVMPSSFSSNISAITGTVSQSFHMHSVCLFG